MESRPWRDAKSRIAAAVMVAALAASTGCGQGPAGDATDRPVVKGVGRETAVERQIVERVEVTGTVRSRHRTVIAAKLQATVLEVLVREGEIVRPDQVLVRLDDKETRAQFHRAEAALIEAKEMLAEADRSIAAAEQAVEAARAQDELSRVTFERIDRLAAQKVSTQQSRDEASARRKAALADLQKALENRAALDARRRQARARIAQAEAELARAKVQLDDATVRSTVSGVVVSRTVEVGNLAVPGTPLFVVDEKAYRLEALVPELDFPRLSLEAPVSVSVGSTVFTSCAVAEVPPNVDTRSRTQIVKVDLPAAPGLQSGRYGVAHFAAGFRKRIDVPREALLRVGQLEAVHVLDRDSIAHFRLVRTGAVDSGRVEILGGLEPGEVVATGPVERLTDGCRTEP